MSLLDCEVEFEPEREGWNAYEVYDGTVLRVKFLLLKLFWRSRTVLTQEPDGAYSGRFQSVIAVKRVNPRLKGFGRGRRLTQQDVQGRPEIREEFMALSEDWNSYRLETGDLLRVKPVVTLVHRVEGVWDEFDDPIYAILSTNVIQAVKRLSRPGLHDPGEER